MADENVLEIKIINNLNENLKKLRLNKYKDKNIYIYIKCQEFMVIMSARHL
jgi:hypothetical protein